MSRTRHPIIAATEFLGGAWAFGGSIWGWTSFGMRAEWPFALTLLGGLLSMYAGAQLWRNHPSGLSLSRVMQSVQLIQIAVPGLVFLAVLAPSLPIGYREGALRVSAEIEERANLALWHHEEPTRFEVNLLALGFLVALRRRRAAESEVGASALPNEIPAV